MTVAREVKRELKEGLAALFAGLSDFDGSTRPEWRTEVSYGYPFGTSAAEFVYFGRTRAQTPPAAMRSGRNYRDEAGELEVIVVCMYVGGDGEDADDRAHAHREQIEDWIADRKNNELDITGLQTLTTRGWESTPFGADSGSGVEIRITVHWTARLT